MGMGGQQAHQPGYANHPQQNLFPDPFNSNQFLSNSSSSGVLADATGNGPGGSSWPPQQQQQQPQQPLTNAYGSMGDPQQMQIDLNASFQPQMQQQNPYQMGGSGDLYQGQGASGMQPRNNAFLEQQQLNKNQSPAQAADETSRKGLRSDVNKTNSVNNQMEQEVRKDK